MPQIAMRTNRRDDIVSAAGELFSARGFHGTSMRDLAKSLDLQGSSLYAHFASKDDLLWEIIDATAATFVAAAESVPLDGSPVDRLRGLIAAHLQVISRELPYATVFFQDWIHLSEGRRTRLIAMRDAYQRRFRDVVAEGVRLGEFATSDVELATLVLLSALNFTYHWLDPRGRLPHEELVARFTEQLVDGLRGTAPATASRPTAAALVPSGAR